MAERPHRVLLDTHALLWWKADGARLSRRAAATIDGAVELHLSPISVWETTMLVQKGRISLDRPTTAWINDLLADPRIRLAELTPRVAVDAGELADFHGDPADRIIVASARGQALPLVTKDRLIRRYASGGGGLTVVW